MRNVPSEMQSIFSMDFICVTSVYLQLTTLQLVKSGARSHVAAAAGMNNRISPLNGEKSEASNTHIFTMLTMPSLQQKSRFSPNATSQIAPRQG